MLENKEPFSVSSINLKASMHRVLAEKSLILIRVSSVVRGIGGSASYFAKISASMMSKCIWPFDRSRALSSLAGMSRSFRWFFGDFKRKRVVGGVKSEAGFTPFGGQMAGGA